MVKKVKQIKKKQNDSYLNSKYVVYRDDDYPKSWVEYQNADVIVKYLTDKKRQKKFEKLNANELKDWMKRLVEKGDASDYVVVFSQDVIPNTVYYDKSDALTREYLNLGGRVVWIGDIPFAIYGKKGQETEPRINDTYAILGAFPAFAFSEDKIIITNEGDNRGLKNHKWYSLRPIHPRHFFSWKHPLLSKRKHILAKSRLKNPLKEQDIYPQRVVGESSGPISTMKSASDFLHTLISLIPALITFVGSLGIIKILDLLNISTVDVNYSLLGWILLLSISISLIVWGVTRSKNFASAWIKDFHNDGEFIRIWDYRPEIITIQMCEDLYLIATYGI